MNVKPIEAIFFRDWYHSHIPEILDEIYIKQIYKPFLLGKKDQIIIDVGANIGLFSYYAAPYAKEVFAIEPDTQHIEELSKMLEFNKIKNVTVCPYAISNKTEKKKLFHNPNTTAHSFSIVNDPTNFEEVETLSFEEFMVRNKLDHIDLLKLDPEGEECKILSSDDFAKYAPKIKVIVGEWHPWTNMDKNQFANLLIDLGYKFNWLLGMKAAVYTAVYMPEVEKKPSIILPPQL